MKFFHLLAPAQFHRLVRTPKRIPNIKIVHTFFKTRDKIPPQLLKSLALSMPKQVFEVNREKLILQYIWRHCVLEKNDVPNGLSWTSYDGLKILSYRNSEFFGYVPLSIIKTDKNYVHSLVESSCLFSTLWVGFR